MLYERKDLKFWIGKTAQSPDLYPVRNLWSILKENIILDNTNFSPNPNCDKNCNCNWNGRKAQPRSARRWPMV